MGYWYQKGGQIVIPLMKCTIMVQHNFILSVHLIMLIPLQGLRSGLIKVSHLPGLLDSP